MGGFFPPNIFSWIKYALCCVRMYICCYDNRLIISAPRLRTNIVLCPVISILNYLLFSSSVLWKYVSRNKCTLILEQNTRSLVAGLSQGNVKSAIKIVLGHFISASTLNCMSVFKLHDAIYLQNISQPMPFYFSANVSSVSCINME